MSPRPRSQRPARRKVELVMPADPTTRKIPSGPSTVPPPARFGAPLLGEMLRRTTLALTAILIVGRAFWPSEVSRVGEQLGYSELVLANHLWTVLILVAWTLFGIAGLVGGHARLRFSWVDAGVVAFLVAISQSTIEARETYVAMCGLWRWLSIGLIYLLVRNVPRSREESYVLITLLFGAAVAESVLALLQIHVELPALRNLYQRDPEGILAQMGILPGTSTARAFEDRLLGSTEPTASFALTNSLAGFLLSVLTAGLGLIVFTLAARSGKAGQRDASWSWSPILFALPVLALIFYVILLTKSRTALLAFVLVLPVLAWQVRHRVSKLWLAFGAGVLALLGVGLGIVAASRGLLDRGVLLDSFKSLRYRLEYWQSTWAMLTDSNFDPRVFWRGLGPDNYGERYMRYKLEVASESITDPHNLLLEAWTTGGLFAMLLLAITLGLALVPILVWRSGRADGSDEGDAEDRAEVLAHTDHDDPPPERQRWLYVAALAGGWVLPVVLGVIVPGGGGEERLRWPAIGVSLVFGSILIVPLVHRGRGLVPALALAALALVINLLFAGGLSFPMVSLALWLPLALAQNLRIDRPESLHRRLGDRFNAFGMAAVVALVVGAYGATGGPRLLSDFYIAQAERARTRSDAQAQRLPGPPNYDTARALYLEAIAADRTSPRPHLGNARLEQRVWQQEGQPLRPNNRWLRVLIELKKAAEPPRPEMNLSVLRIRGRFLQDLLTLNARSDDPLPPDVTIRLNAQRVRDYRVATQIAPTDSSIHANLAFAEADIGRFDVATDVAREALRLDDVMPHVDKKLPDLVRRQLEVGLREWAEATPLLPDPEVLAPGDNATSTQP